MNTERLFLHGALDLEARQRFITAVRAAMETADEDVVLDCSVVDVAAAIEDLMIGMLVTLAHAARRQGARVVLVRAPRPMRLRFEAAGVAHFFNWRP